MHVTETNVWQELLKHKEALAQTHLSELILGDPKRLDNCHIELDGLRLDFTFNLFTPKTIELLIRLVQQQKLEEWRDRMFRGDKINTTENRAVLHTALRQKTGSLLVDGHDIIRDVMATRQRMGSFVADVREGRWRGTTGKAIKHIVNIGIGGSDLGPRLAVQALAPFADDLQTHFVANADAFDLTSTLANLDPTETLFIIVSKTFTTQETLLNANSARKWLVDKYGAKAVAQHFVAVSSNIAEAEKFGIAKENIFPMPDWVGGRYSLWSAVGLSIALSIGMENFERMLAGAAKLDDHFLTAPLNRNMPILLALFGIWYRNFWKTSGQAILPYSERLRDLPRYLQQLEMESNGKSVSRDGETINYATAPIVFGDCGTVGQHSFHQCIHQGTDIIPADFIGVAKDDLDRPEHHKVLLANLVAQAGALAFGQKQKSSPSDIYPGNRPSNIITLQKLDPYHFGMLLALYEHKVFTQGIVWNINSFDQPGVELGKNLARKLESPLSSMTTMETFLAGFLGTIRPNPKN